MGENTIGTDQPVHQLPIQHSMLGHHQPASEMPFNTFAEQTQISRLLQELPNQGLLCLLMEI